MTDLELNDAMMETWLKLVRVWSKPDQAYPLQQNLLKLLREHRIRAVKKMTDEELYEYAGLTPE